MHNEATTAATGRAVIEITSADDPRIEAFCNIKERDLTGRQGRFIAEGTVVLRMLAAAHREGGAFEAECILVLKNRLEGVADILAEFPASVPLYVADAAVLDAIAGFHLHRGILALGRRLAGAQAGGDATGQGLDSLIAQLPKSSLVVVGCGISNHDNIGGMFRNAAAFYADAVLLDETCCDPLYRKALRVSVGSVLAVPYTREGKAVSLLEKLAAEGFTIWALSPSGETEIRNIPVSERMALVIGTEGDGLPPEVLSRFRTARISQSARLDSLNAGTSSGLALYQMAAALGRL
jgi:tRNA G18 (ribose-2'-O)-methylase SpoU